MEGKIYSPVGRFAERAKIAMIVHCSSTLTLLNYELSLTSFAKQCFLFFHGIGEELWWGVVVVVDLFTHRYININSCTKDSPIMTGGKNSQAIPRPVVWVFPVVMTMAAVACPVGLPCMYITVLHVSAAHGWAIRPASRSSTLGNIG